MPDRTRLSGALHQLEIARQRVTARLDELGHALQDVQAAIGRDEPVTPLVTSPEYTGLRRELMMTITAFVSQMRLVRGLFYEYVVEEENASMSYLGRVNRMTRQTIQGLIARARRR